MKLYPKKAQLEAFQTWQDCCRFVWNICLEQRIDALKKHHDLSLYRFPSKASQKRELVFLKQECEWLKETPAIMLQSVVGSLDDAFKRRWKRISGFPRFKSKSKRQTTLMHIPKMFCGLKNGFISMPHIGYVKFRGMKKLPDNFIGIDILPRTDGTFEGSLCFKFDEIKKQNAPQNSIAGIDLGITHFLTLSDGSFVENPRFFQESMKTLAKEQRCFSRRQRGSNRREKQRLQVAKLHRHVANQRKDFLHKLSRTIVKNHEIVAIEDLSVTQMLKNTRRKLARSIADVGWFTFRKMLEYKIEEHCGKLVVVNPAYTSQTCNKCNHIDSENRNGKRFVCTRCGNSNDADVNAAQNILKRAKHALRGESQKTFVEAISAQQCATC